jgi:predicted ribosome quality control (RQC) complex YloA/Tae2 family protein
MVFYFKTRCGGYTIYMGRDKHENEDLIKYGLDCDVWFHVDDLSSAHVYLRLKPGGTMDDIPEDALLDCAALVKANSIAGCKVGLN